MITSDVINAYLDARRAQGLQSNCCGRKLRQFARETGDQALDQVTRQEVSTFLRGHGALSATWTLKYRVLAGLYRFALAHKPQVLAEAVF